MERMKIAKVAVSDELAETLETYHWRLADDPRVAFAVEAALWQFLSENGNPVPMRKLRISSAEPDGDPHAIGLEPPDAPVDAVRGSTEDRAEPNVDVRDRHPAESTLDEATLRQRLAEMQYRPASKPFELPTVTFDSGLTDVSIEHDRYLAEESYSDRQWTAVRNPRSQRRASRPRKRRRAAAET
jgi:hypothetical protein